MSCPPQTAESSRLCGVLLTTKIDSAVSSPPGFRLSLVLHTPKSDFAEWITWGPFVWIRKYVRKRNQIQNCLSRGPGRFVSWKELWKKISWQTLFIKNCPIQTGESITTVTRVKPCFPGKKTKVRESILVLRGVGVGAAHQFCGYPGSYKPTVKTLISHALRYFHF